MLFCVSIPHRYDKNLPNVFIKEHLDRLVSIPHRYDKNEMSELIFVCDRTVSIPHRYDKNCLDFKGFLEPHPGFNPS